MDVGTLNRSPVAAAARFGLWQSAVGKMIAAGRSLCIRFDAHYLQA